jgi:hypothetical protein
MGTYYAEYTTDSVSSPLLLKDSTEFVSLTVDSKDCIHVVESEENDSAFQLVHRFKANGSWQSQIIEENLFYLSTTDLQVGTSCIHLVYGLTDTIGGLTGESQYSNIFYRKLDIPPGIGDQENQPGIVAYPNPFRESITFELPAGNNAILALSILDIYGVPVYHEPSENLKGIENKFTWNGLNDSGIVVPDGLYIIKLLLEKGCVSTKIIKISR